MDKKDNTTKNIADITLKELIKSPYYLGTNSDGVILVSKEFYAEYKKL